MQIVSIGDILNEMSNPVSWEKNKKKYFKILSAENFAQSSDFKVTAQSESAKCKNVDI